MNTENEKKEIIQVQMEDGTIEECQVVTSFVNETTNKNYVVYTPVEELNNDEDKVFLYGAIIQEDEDGEPIMVQVSEKEDIELLNKVIETLAEESKEEE